MGFFCFLIRFSDKMSLSTIKREADTTIRPVNKRQKIEKIDEGNYEFKFYEIFVIYLHQTKLNVGENFLVGFINDN